MYGGPMGGPMYGGPMGGPMGATPMAQTTAMPATAQAPAAAAVPVAKAYPVGAPGAMADAAKPYNSWHVGMMVGGKFLLPV